MYIPKTARRKGFHTMPVAAPKKLGSTIKATPYPKLPKLPKLPTTHTNKSRY